MLGKIYCPRCGSEVPFGDTCNNCNTCIKNYRQGYDREASVLLLKICVIGGIYFVCYFLANRYDYLFDYELDHTKFDEGMWAFFMSISVALDKHTKAFVKKVRAKDE